MVIHESKVRVRYGETDKMGYCYYGVYAQYFEIGRTELMRNFGLSYKDIENQGIMLPVLTLNVKFIKPAFYDDELTIKTFLTRLPSVRIEFLYEIFNQNNELVNTGDTTLVFIHSNSRKPLKAPLSFVNALIPYF
jgi:acyl-CoA thioester hydrolase